MANNVELRNIKAYSWGKNSHEPLIANVQPRLPVRSITIICASRLSGVFAETLSGMIETKSFSLERRANLIEFDNSLIMGLTIADPYPLTNPLIRYIFYTMKFTFDADKSLANLSKHGIDFGEAQTLWNDPDLLEIPAKTIEEPRHLIIGKIDHKHWSAVITYRDQSIRIISVRRSRPEEINLYES